MRVCSANNLSDSSEFVTLFSVVMRSSVGVRQQGCGYFLEAVHTNADPVYAEFEKESVQKIDSFIF